MGDLGATRDGGVVERHRNRITGGGVTAGIDMALQLLALLNGESEAKQVQLQLEYAPQPPFNCGRPEAASDALVAQVRARLARQVAAVEPAI